MLSEIADIANPLLSVAEVVMYDFVNSFRTLYYDNQSAEWMIFEIEQDMTKRQAEQNLLLEVQTYVHSPEGSIRIKLILISMYNLVTDVVMNTDPALFDLLYGFASGATDPSMIVWTPELIHGYLQHAIAFFDVIELSIDDTEKTLLGLFLSDLVGIYVRSQDLPALEAASLIVEYNAILLYYLDALDEIYTMMDTFLTNLTPEQIGIVMEILPKLINGGKVDPTPVQTLGMEEPIPVITEEPGIGSEAEMVQAIATLIHVLCTDAGFDPALLAGYAIDVYFLAKYGPSGANPDLIAAVKAAVLGNIEQLILLSNEIVTFDIDTMTPEQLAVGYEFFERMQYLVSIFKLGPEGIDLEPDFGISEADFVALVEQLFRPKNEEELDAAVAMMLGIFNLPMEETYFTLLSFMPLIQEIQTIDSYESFLLFYESLPGRGFSNEMISEYLVNFLVGMVDYQIIRENTNFAEYVAYLEQAILESGDQIDYYENKINTQFAGFEAAISLLTPDDQTIIHAYMAFYELLLDAEATRQAAEDYAKNDALNHDLFWSYSYFYVEWQLQSMYMYPSELEFYTNLYNTARTSLPTEVLALYQPILDAAAIYFDYLYTDLSTFESACMNMVDPSIYYQVSTYFYFEYQYDRQTLENNYQYYASLVEQFADAQAPNTSMLLAIQTFFDEPESVQLTKDVVLIILDEAGYYIANIDQTTIALIQSIMQAANPGDVLDTTAAGILGYVDRLSDILDMFGMTISSEDDATLQLFAAKVLWIVLEQTGMTPEELAIHFPVYEAAIGEVYFKAEQVLLIFNAFLDSLTEAKIQVVMNQITLLNTIPADEAILPEELNYYNFLRAIAIANIIQALTGDGSLDTDTLIAYSIQGYFDFEYLFEYSGPIDEAVLIAEKQALIDAIILQCGVIDEYLPTTIDPLEIGEIDELRILIEQLIFFLQTGPEYIPE